MPPLLITSIIISIIPNVISSVNDYYILLGGIFVVFEVAGGWIICWDSESGGQECPPFW